MTKEYTRQEENEWYQSQDERFDSLVFTSGFTPLWATAQKHHMQERLGESVVHTAETVCPWPGAIPALLTEHDERAVPYAVGVGTMTALLYMHDDIVDGRTVRCGVETALGRYGEDACRKTFDTATTGAIDLDPALFPLDMQGAWVDTIAGFKQAQRDRAAAGTHMGLDDYFAQTARRLGFIEQWWSRAAAAAGDSTLAQFLLEASPFNTTACQIRNDVRNTQPQEVSRGGKLYSDFYEGKMTAVTIRVLQRLDMLDTGEQEWLTQRVWSSNEPIESSEIARMDTICAQTHVIEDSTSHLNEVLLELDHNIQQAPITHTQKLLLRAQASRRYASGMLPNHPLRDPSIIEELEMIV